MAQINLSTVPDQMFCRTAIRDFNDNAAAGVRYNYPCAKTVKPGCRRKFVRIKRLAIGHQKSSVIFPGHTMRPGQRPHKSGTIEK